MLYNNTDLTPPPWNFPTDNVRRMLIESLDVADRAGRQPDNGVNEADLLVAANNLRHAADELERSLYEMKYGVRRGI